MNHAYHQVATAIRYIRDHFTEQPELDLVAQQVHMSPFHFQRLFREWAGVSPKKFLQYISIEHAKKLLDSNYSLSDASFATGLSGTSRLHDLFVTIEGMTPGEYKNGGEGLVIQYSQAASPFGDILIASTRKGICHLSFASPETRAEAVLRESFPHATLVAKTDSLQQDALSVFAGDRKDLPRIKLHLKASRFQLKVWQSLLHIPYAGVRSYGDIAAAINQSGAARAVGAAVGANPVAFLIPCHRVIQASGATGQYHWGSDRKAAMIGWEAAHVYGEEQVA